MSAPATKRRYVHFALLAGFATGSVSLIGQRPTSAVQETTGICMADVAVCQRGDVVSIGSEATDADMSKLDTLQGVKEIAFMIGPYDTGDPGPDEGGGPKITGAGFLHIQNLHELEVLDAIDLPLLTDEALRSLTNLSHLHEARFEGNRHFTDDGVAYFAGLTDLRMVAFHDTAITDKALQYLRASADLENLQLGRSRITDKGARQIARFRKLKTLDLQGTQITDKAVGDIATLPNLQWLCLRDTSVTDQGLLALRSAITLRDLYISPDKFNDATIASLQHSLPELKVHLR
jgi:Leucine-rich repeat (LRR) protein